MKKIVSLGRLVLLIVVVAALAPITSIAYSVVPPPSACPSSSATTSTTAATSASSTLIKKETGRREVLQRWCSTSSMIVSAAALWSSRNDNDNNHPGSSGSSNTDAWAAATLEKMVVGTCPRGSNNCIRTTWTTPAAASSSSGRLISQASDAAKTLLKVLNAYPKEGGQAGVDLGGWNIASTANVEAWEKDPTSQPLRVEFTSGIGNFAKFLNGGKPFIDDVWFQIEPISSSSSEDVGQPQQRFAVQVKSSSRVGDSDLGVNQKRLLFFTKALAEQGWDVPEPTY